MARREAFPGRQKAAYDLRRDGCSWTEISAILEYADWRGPQRAAAAYAKKHDLPPAEPRNRTTRRNCLGCGRGFDSWGIGNRMCRTCKRSPAYSGPAEHRVMA